MARRTYARLVLVVIVLLAIGGCGDSAARAGEQGPPRADGRTAETALPTPDVPSLEPRPEERRSLEVFTPALSEGERGLVPLTPTPSDGQTEQRVRVGLEMLLEERLELVRGRRVGLVTNQSGVDSAGRSAVELLGKQPQVKLIALFSPEHGLRGRAEAGQSVADGRDSESGLRVYSLYGAQRRPSAAQLRDVEMLVVDLQDVGLRFYTYVATLVEVLRAGAEHGRPVVVLDRPAPLTGVAVEGNVLEPAFASFVGPFPLPARYGLTLGELARLLNEHFRLGAELVVVPMQGWERGMWYDQTGLPWVPPSPNLPTLEAATAYAGTVLFEGTNLSEGRGTARPFQWIGAPWVDGPLWAEALNALGLPGVRFEAVEFTPSSSKYAGERCWGVALQVVDRERFRPITATLHMLATVRRLHPERFAFRAEHFDLLAGTDATRRALEAGTPATQIVEPWREQRAGFESVRQRYLLYQ